jgi:hypothetical protein
MPSLASWCPQRLDSEYAVPACTRACSPLGRSGNAVGGVTCHEGSNPSRSAFLYQISDICRRLATVQDATDASSGVWTQRSPNVIGEQRREWPHRYVQWYNAHRPYHALNGFSPSDRLGRLLRTIPCADSTCRIAPTLLRPFLRAHA